MMHRSLLAAAMLVLTGCSTAPSIKSAPDAVALPGRIAKASRVDREYTAPLMVTVPIGKGWLELPTSTITSHTRSTMMYTLAISNHEPVEVDAPGEFTVGQCVVLYVRRAHVDNTRFFPTSAQLETYDGCP